MCFMRTLWFGQTLFDRVYSMDNLARAWRKVRAAKGAPGTDGVSIADFEVDWAANAGQLARELREQTYVPVPPRRFSLPRADGKGRPIAILAVRDRLAQRAVQNVIEPLFEERFLDCSFGYRPGRNTAQAVEAVLRARDAGYTWVVDADIAAFFDSLDQQLLLEEVARVINDRKILRLLRLWLDTGLLEAAALVADDRPRLAPLLHDGLSAGLDGVMDWGLRQLGGDADGLESLEEAGRPPDPRVEALRRTASGLALLALSSRRTLGAAARRLGRPPRSLVVVSAGGAAVAGVAALLAPQLSRRSGAARRATGTLQGSVLSPLLANAYLHPLDLALVRRYPHVVRYADDLLILCRSEGEALAALEHLRRTLAEHRLRLRQEKTSVHGFEQPFVFLGYRFADGTATPPVSAPRAAVARVQATRARLSRRVRRRGRGARRRARQARAVVGTNVERVVEATRRSGGQLMTFTHDQLTKPLAWWPGGGVIGERQGQQAREREERHDGNGLSD